MPLLSRRKLLVPRCARRRGGATATEVALILAILVTGILMVFAEVGDRVNHSLVALADGVPSELARDANASSSPSAPSASVTSVLPQTASEWSRFVILAAQVCVAIGAIGVVAFRKRLRMLPVEEPETLPSPSSTLPLALFEKRQAMLKLFGKSLLRSHLADIPVTLVMSRHIERVETSLTRNELRERMKVSRVRHLAVCDVQGRLLGIVSDRDLGTREGKTAAELMTRDPVTVTSQTGLIAAVTLMINRGFSCLPVVDDGQLTGIFTTTDLLLAFQATVLMVQRPDAVEAGFGPAPAAATQPAAHLAV